MAPSNPLMPPPPVPPRRSGRERRQAGNTSISSQPQVKPSKKRKSQETISDDESDLTELDVEEEIDELAEQDDEEEEDEDEPDADDGSEDDFEASFIKPKKTPSKRTPAKGGRKSKGKKTNGSDDEADAEATPKAKKARGRPKGAGSTKKGKGKAVDGAEGEADDDENQPETDVKADNIFFNALISGNAMEPVIEDWVDRYEEEPDQALGELVVFLIRASGSSTDVTPDAAVDLDGVVSTVDDLENEKSMAVYPLISKVKAYRRFHASLSSFLSLLLSNLANTPHLYSSSASKSDASPLIEVLQSWLFTLSASQLRSFRHTGTVVALEVMTGLCEVAAEVREELGTVSRQKEAERRKVDKGTSGAKARLKELERKVKEVHWKKTKLENYLTEFFNTVFVLRYRDRDPLIRTECVKQLGIWMKTLPDIYLESAYFKYVGWMLDDESFPTRLETVRALLPLYQNDANAGGLSSFTERFKKRILQMAFHDVELSVRTTAIGILNFVDRSGMLDDERRRQVGLLIFDREDRVRKAVAGFFADRWTEDTEEMLEEMEGAGRKGRKGNKKDQAVEDKIIKERVGWKSLASMLVRFTRALDEANEEPDEGANYPDRAARETAEELKAWIDMTGKSRIASAVDSLWDKVDGLRNWESLIQFVGLDHSGEGDGTADEVAGDEIWTVDEEEVALLIQVLVAGMRKAKSKAEADKKNDSTVPTEMTRILIRDLPALIAKHQSDVGRLVDVLSIPLLMNLNMYLDLRMVPAYESLWDDLIKILTKSSTPEVLNPTIAAIIHLLSTEALANANAKKIAELDEALFSALRSIVDGRDAETAEFDEDENVALASAAMRIGLLFCWRNLCEAMDESEGGTQSTGWQILLALASRGSLGYRDEGQMVDHALEALSRYIFYRTSSDPEDGSRQEDLLAKRSALLEKLEEFAVGTQSNAVEAVRRSSFVLLLTQHIAFRPTIENLTPAESKLKPIAIPKALELELDEEVQSRCAGFIEAEIERYTEDKLDLTASQAAAADEMSDEEAEDEDEDEEEGVTKKKRKSKSVAKAKKFAIDDGSVPSQTELLQNHRFMSTISHFLVALRLRVIGVEHSTVIFTHHGRFGSEYDALCKSLADDLRLDACGGHGASVVKVVIASMQNSFELFLDGETTEAEPLALSKMLASSLAVHGPQFKILKSIPSRHVVDIHTALLDWVVKKVAQAGRRNNKKSVRSTLLFFKALTPLLGTVDGRGALSIKHELDETLKRHSVEVESAKTWDHERAYEKRLTAVMAKDAVITKRARTKLATRSGGATEGAEAEPGHEDSEEDRDNDDDDDDEEENPLRIPEDAETTKPPGPYLRRSRGAVGAMEDEDEEEFPEQQPSRPKSKPRTRGTVKAVEPEPEVEMDEEEVDVNVSPPASVKKPSTAGRKRNRDEDEEEEEEDVDVNVDLGEAPEVDVEEESQDDEEGLTPAPSSPLTVASSTKPASASASSPGILDTGRVFRKKPRIL